MEYLKDAWSLVSGVWKCSAEHAAYIIDLEDNLASLRSESLKLKNISEDVTTRVREIEGQEKRVRNENQVHGWLKRVEAMENEVDEILQKGEQEVGNKCLGSCCPKNCCSSYEVGTNVLEMIPQVTKLTEEWKLDVVADELPPPPVGELLRDYLTALRSAMFKLRNLKGDVINRVTVAEKQRMRRTNQVSGWLTSVEAVEKEGNQLLQKGVDELEDNCVTSSSPKNRGSSYNLLEEVKKMVPQVTALTEEGEFDVVAHPLPPPPVDEQPMDNVVVGFESKFDEVWQSVRNYDSLVVGLVGMGGVGKTTLLKQLNNEFLKATHGYDLVIWIVVSKPANLGSIRDAIRRKLDIPDHIWQNESEDSKNRLLFRQLKEKKFVVLLDDVWETLELTDVGIPRPSMHSPGSKIVLTTRSQEVCRSIGADKIIAVDCLPPEQAFSLFCSQLGEDILKSHPHMQGLIADVANKCDGLPLALCTVGRAMRGKKTARQWNQAKTMLEKYPSKFQGMDDVFSKLVFSYDSLPNPMVKKCFEYCSLYPEDYNISEEDVIKLWLAEGFISECDSMYDSLIQGREIVESLKQACLLETGEYDILGRETVRMHDMIREMALWVACEQGEKSNKFLVQVASAEIRVATNAMSNVEKMSLWGRGIATKSLAGMSFPPNMSTLIIRYTDTEVWPSDFFPPQDSLIVLDLTGNMHLGRFPVENGCLENLVYFNMAFTCMDLPEGVSQWKKLRFLIVDEHTIIPGGVISSLDSLQMFEQQVQPERYREVSNRRKSIEREILHELEGLKYIMDIRLALCSATGMEILMDSPKLLSCTTGLTVREVDASIMLDLGTETSINHLERLLVEDCKISEIKLGPSLAKNLCEVCVMQCHEILNLSSLIYVPNLSILHVRYCRSMSELIGEETRSSNVGTSLFSSLTSLTLANSPKLWRICPQSALPFPSLKSMRVEDCKNLVKLPLDSNTATTAPPELKIQGQREWWDGLEWDSQATKDALTPKFIVMD